MTVRFIQPADLLELADELVGRGNGAGRPKAIRLRRGVSSAYYAVFHELSYRVVQRALDPAGWGPKEAAVARWVAHTDLADLCKAATGSGRPVLADALAAMNSDVQRIASAFLDLQDQRHQADYDDLYDVSKATAVGFVDIARDAVDRSWQLFSQADADYRRFLALGLGAVKIAKSRG